MYAKIEIRGYIKLMTGMHIGGSSEFSAIGAVDSPVIRDARLNLPMIPGSSLKGKMRTLLAKQYNTDIATVPNGDDDRLLRLFGSSEKGKIKRSRVLISDMFIANANQLRSQGVQSLTEVKFENTINRATAVANPRQIERAIRGSMFKLGIIYEAENFNEIQDDIETLAQGMKLLQYDYLGGNGSRGYGKIQFTDISANLVVGEISSALIKECNEILKRAVDNA